MYVLRCIEELYFTIIKGPTVPEPQVKIRAESSISWVDIADLIDVYSRLNHGCLVHKVIIYGENIPLFQVLM